MTKRFEITNIASGHCFGIYEAETKEAALDAMARDAGYESYAEANKEFPVEDGEIVVEEVATPHH